MLTARKVFSYSLTISAASGEETRCRCAQVWRKQLGRPPEAGLGDPAEHARGLQLLVAGDAGIDTLGGERDADVLADRRPRSASGSTSSSRVQPTYVVEVSTSVWPGRAWRTTCAQASSRIAGSGRRCSSIGVGTQISTRSAASSASTRSVRTKRPPARCARRSSSSEASSSASPARIACRRAAEMSIPTISAPALPMRDRRRQADIAEADDRDDRMGDGGLGRTRGRRDGRRPRSGRA